MEQIKFAKSFIEKKVIGASLKDLILFAGDFNVNGQQDNKGIDQFRDRIIPHVKINTYTILARFHGSNENIVSRIFGYDECIVWQWTRDSR